MHLLALGLAGLVATVLGYAGPGPEVEVVYQGESCGCGKTLGYSVQSTCPAAKTEARINVGYQIVMPPIPPPTPPSYAFDFHIEVPQPKEQVQLGSYDYNVVVPPRPIEEDIALSEYGYQLQTPVASPPIVPIEPDLYSAVDRVLLNRPDCVQTPSTSKCNCPRYKPTIDILPPCPNHCRGKREISFEEYALNSAAKHEMNQFYDRTKPLEHMLMDSEAADAIFNNAHKKTAKPKPNMNENRLRLKKFFEALMLPKAEVSKNSVISKRTPSPYPMRPMDDEAVHMKSILPALRQRWAQIFAAKGPGSNQFADQRRKRDVVWEMMAKEGDENEKGSDPLAAQKRVRKQCPTCGSTRHSHCEGRQQQQPQQRPLQMPSPRPIYVEFVKGEPVPYAASPNGQHDATEGPPQTPQPDRYVFDQMGHRYLERNGNLRLVAPQPIVINENENVGSPRYQPTSQYTEVLEDILDHNQAIIKEINLNDGHLVSDPVDLTVDSLNFLHEITDQRNRNAEESPLPPPTPPPPPPPMYAPRAAPPQYYPPVQPYHQQPYPPPYPGPMNKRSFAITPLLQDQQDGSVLVKISPRKHKKFDPANAPETKKYPSRSFKSGDTGSSTGIRHQPISTEGPPLASNKHEMRVTKLKQDDQSFEIVTLDSSGRPIGNDGATDEDLAVLRYIYESQTNRRKMQDEARASAAAENVSGQTSNSAPAKVHHGPPTASGQLESSAPEMAELISR